MANANRHPHRQVDANSASASLLAAILRLLHVRLLVVEKAGHVEPALLPSSLPVSSPSPLLPATACPDGRRHRARHAEAVAPHDKEIVGAFAVEKSGLHGLAVLHIQFEDMPDLDTALDWAARCPAASTGAVEVRPNLAM